MRRDADDLIRPEQCAGAGTGEVALPDVDAVGPHLDRNLHVVVDDAHDAAAAAEGDKAARFLEEILPAHMLFAQLDEGGTAVDGGPDAAEEVLRIRRPRAVGHGIEPQLLRSDVHKKCLLFPRNKNADGSAGPVCSKLIRISLRWHDPNQVMGRGRPAPSQPASAGSPIHNGKIIHRTPPVCKGLGNILSKNRRRA